MDTIDYLIKEAESKRDRLEKLFSDSIKINDPQVVNMEINKLNSLIYCYKEMKQKGEKMMETNFENREHYPILKIKSKDGDFITSEITLNGNTIPGLKGIEISGSAIDNSFLVKLEIQANLEFEIPATVKAKMN